MVRVTIDVPDYSPETGLRMAWEPDAIITANMNGGLLHLTANQDGLVSLARLFLTLASPGVSPGNHWHLDESNGLEGGSFAMIIERV